MTWLDWMNAHAGEIAIIGAFVAQLAVLLPDTWKVKAPIVNLLHGLFPSPQVMTKGETPTPKDDTK